MMNEGHRVNDIYFNFAKTFEFVNHRFLLAKMNSISLSDDVVWLIKAYLSGRVSTVHVGEELSGTISLQGGVPHGSEIDHLLVLLFVNHLADALEALTLIIADDVKLATPRPQNMDSCLIAAWDSSQILDIPVKFA